MAEVLLEDMKLPALWSGAERQTFEQFALSHMVVSLMDFIPVAQRAAIRAYTSTFNCDSAFTEALAALGSLGGTILCPAGQYTFATQKHLRKRIRLLGETGMFNAAELLTRFIFSANVGGFVVHLPDTGESGRESPELGSSVGSVFDGIHMQGSGTSNTTTGHGIWLRGPAVVRNCTVNTFAGNGVNIDADLSSADDFLYGNADGWLLDTVMCRSNYHGVYVHGANANGMAIGCSCLLNRHWGFYDESESVVTHIGHHTATNVDGAYYFDDDAYGTLIGCYSEQGQAGSNPSPGGTLAGDKTVVLGGLQSSGQFLLGTVGTGNPGVITTTGAEARVTVLNSYDGSIPNGFYMVIGSTPNRQQLSMFKNGNVMFGIAYEADGSGAAMYQDYRWDSTPRAWRREHGTKAVELVTSSIGSGASASSRLKDEDGSTLTNAYMLWPRHAWFPSLSDSGEYRQLQIFSGSQQQVSYLATGDFTLATTDPLAGSIVIDCGGAGRTVTLPTAALLVSVVRNTPIVSQIIRCQICNGSDANEVITIAAGSGGTWDSNQTATSRVIPQNRSRILRIRLTNVSAGTEAYTINL